MADEPDRSEAHFGWFLGLLASSVSLLMAANFLRFSALAGILLACAPLVVYHVRLWRRADQLLTQAEIDSVYYFGFLITIVALALAAYDVGSASGLQVDRVIRQFAVGIVATAYAILARQHLATLAPETEGGSVEKAADRQLARARDVMAHMITAAESAKQLSRSLEEARQSIARGTAEEVKRTLRAMVTEFADELSPNLKKIGDTTNALSKDLEVFADRTLGSRTAASMERLAAAAEAFEGRVVAAGDASMEMAAGVGLMRGELATLSEEVGRAREAIAGIANAGQQLGEQTDAVHTSSGALRKAAEQLLATVESMREMGEQIAEAPRGVKKLVDQTARTAAGVTHLAELATQLSESVGQLSSLGDAMQRIETMAQGLAELGPQATSQVAGLGEQAGATSKQLAHLRDSALSAADGAVSVRVLASTLVEGGAAVGTIGKSISALEERVVGLSKVLDDAIHGLENASSDLARATKGSTERVQADIARASENVAGVTKRLVDLVEALIEATARQRRTRP